MRGAQRHRPTIARRAVPAFVTVMTRTGRVAAVEPGDADAVALRPHRHEAVFGPGAVVMRHGVGAPVRAAVAGTHQRHVVGVGRIAALLQPVRPQRAVGGRQHVRCVGPVDEHAVADRDRRRRVAPALLGDIEARELEHVAAPLARVHPRQHQLVAGAGDEVGRRRARTGRRQRPFHDPARRFDRRRASGTGDGSGIIAAACGQQQGRAGERQESRTRAAARRRMEGHGPAPVSIGFSVEGYPFAHASALDPTPVTTIVARYADPIEAQIACGLLQAEGIDVHVGDAHMALANWEWRLAIGGVKLHVPDQQLEPARELIRRLDAGEFALADDDDVASDEPSAPPPRESLSSRLAWIALMVFSIPLPWRRKR
ncbi:hypothetical protein CMZ84_07990 [Lysobacteraceae bacterium NML93-0399]|nr:hypothetical protein CMZ84_07990 [Xanthomonadaceae bacterium NML93-0399]